MSLDINAAALVCFLLAVFALGFGTGIIVLIAAQVREAKRRAALSEVLDRRRVP